ncbi:MAG TPA: nucleotidyltransferase domain-containing protein [Verrucomicrobiota bacterium]|nr:nucleotidyltransferase domain-containing protein [Verrucomicrobiota bacterium]
MNPLAAIASHRAALRELGARRIGIFGSFACGEERSDSDVDVYVEFDEAKRTYDNFFCPSRTVGSSVPASRRSGHG